MDHLYLAAFVFFWLSAVALTAIFMFPKLPQKHRDDDTTTTVRLVANLFVVMTSLLFGLMINSTKTTFEGIDASVHQYATSLIIIDRTLRHYGPDGDAARASLADYVQAAVETPIRPTQIGNTADVAGIALEAFGDALAGIGPGNTYQQDILANIRQQYQDIVHQRWAIVEQSEGRIPMALILMLVTWLTLIFVSYGYRAPANAMVYTSIIASALLLSVSLYLALDMDIPFSGPIQVMDEPLRRAAVALAS